MDERLPNQLGRNKDFAASQSHHGARHEGSTKHMYDARGRMLQQRQRVRGIPDCWIAMLNMCGT